MSSSLDLFGARVGDKMRRMAGRMAPRRIVTLHHLACSGGTVMTKCLAAMPEAMVLSEIHPERTAQPAFHPLSQLQRGYHTLLTDEHRETIRSHFRREIGITHGIAQSLGRKLVVRDHAHVDFAERKGTRSALADALAGEFEMTPIVTVRDPRETWLSLQRESWFEGAPDDLCAAQLALLDAFPGAAVFRYEDFAADPDRIVREMCAAAGIGFEAGFEDRLGSVTHLTGDSGRKGEKIAPRPPRPLPADAAKAFESSASFRTLAERLHYS